MKKLVIGILAHVDAGKTTLSEALLYLCGCIRRLGRVDHRDTFLDTNAMERARGITIFSKQAMLETPSLKLCLLDTPGHTDFSAEMERTLSVLDYAILVVSATDGVQVHTETLWRLLAHRHIPTFLFINKTDLPGFDRQALMEHLHARLSPACVDFGTKTDDLGLFEDQTAVCSDRMTEEYLETGHLSERSLIEAVRARELFPCRFGSALRMEGVSSFLGLLETYTAEPEHPDIFGAKVFKVGRDPAGARLTFLKLTGGSLRVRQTLSKERDGETLWEEKIDQIRIYSGEKYKTADSAQAGEVCCVTGLSFLRPGDGIGAEPDEPQPLLEPVLSYRVILPPDVSAQDAYPKLKQFAEEDPVLHLHWNPALREIGISLMGEIQMDVLTHEILERTGLSVTFDMGKIVYRETISEPVECAGHYEPLRHYAEVHLLLEPGEPGSGITWDTVCPENVLGRNWQRLILSQLQEELPRGVLTGSDVTDLRVVLTGGRAHLKHTEGGDFLQAASRAFRQGLMKAREAGNAVLLEPWYDFRLVVPQTCTGRAINDIERMCGTLKPVGTDETTGMAILTGCAPASEMRVYHTEVQTYTRGRGQLSLTLHGCAPCHDTDRVIAETGYDPVRDLDYPADSVFCSAGAGVLVPWREADAHMHVESVFSEKKPQALSSVSPSGRVLSSRSGMSHARPRTYADAMEEDRELKAIFERTYGPISPRSIFVPPPPVTQVAETRDTYLKKLDPEETYLLVDGYNIIFAWEELEALARDSLDLARSALIHILSNYQGFRRCNLILVFDAYRVSGGVGTVEKHGGVYVIYTRQKETADSYIEKVTYDIGRSHRVRVATSDAMEQIIVLGHGAERVSARAFRDEVMTAGEELEEAIAALNRTNR